MTGNANFATPVPALTAVTAAISALDTAHTTAKGGGTDDTANMHVKELIFDLILKQLAAYVEATANANPIAADAIILSAGMEVKQQAIRGAQDLCVSRTKTPGEVRLAVKSAPRCTFTWQMSTDPSQEEGWSTIATSTRAVFIQSGLTPGVKYYFRVNKIDKDGMGPWSSVLDIMAV